MERRERSCYLETMKEEQQYNLKHHLVLENYSGEDWKQDPNLSSGHRAAVR